MSWFLALLGICALIVLHELGHFAVAKLVGMRVERFSLFFPPTLFKVRRGETEYAIGAIPAGGYVKIAGMNPEELDGPEPEVARRAYYNQPVWKRVAVIAAGPAVNILIAFLIFWVVLMAGNLAGVGSMERLNPSIRTRSPPTPSVDVEQHAPASGVLRPGDRILTVEGRRADIASTEARIAATPVPAARPRAAAPPPRCT